MCFRYTTKRRHGARLETGTQHVGIDSTKKPGVVCMTPGLRKLEGLRADVTCAGDTNFHYDANAHFPNFRHIYTGNWNTRIALRADSPG